MLASAFHVLWERSGSVRMTPIRGCHAIFGFVPLTYLYVVGGSPSSGFLDMNILPYVFAFGMVVLGPLFSLVAHFCLGSSLGGHSLPLAHLSGASFRSPLGCSVLVQFLVNQSLASVMIFIVSVLLGRLVGCSMPMFLDMGLAFAFCSLVSTLLLDGCPWSFAILSPYGVRWWLP